MATYTFTDQGGQERVIEGDAAFKAYLLDGGLDFLKSKAGGAAPESDPQKDAARAMMQAIIDGTTDPLTVDFDNLEALHANYGSDPEVAALFEKAAKAGDLLSAFNAGSILAEGRSDLSPNIPQAMHWYRQAAEAGYASAQHNLASLHARGMGTPRDWEAATLWFGKAAAQGHTTARMELGTMLASGTGGTRDFAQGMKLLRSAAGDPRLADSVKQRIEAVCRTTWDASEADLCAGRP